MARGRSALVALHPSSLSQAQAAGLRVCEVRRAGAPDAQSAPPIDGAPAAAGAPRRVPTSARGPTLSPMAALIVPGPAQGAATGQFPKKPRGLPRIQGLPRPLPRTFVIPGRVVSDPGHSRPRGSRRPLPRAGALRGSHAKRRANDFRCPAGGDRRRPAGAGRRLPGPRSRPGEWGLLGTWGARGAGRGHARAQLPAHGPPLPVCRRAAPLPGRRPPPIGGGTLPGIALGGAGARSGQARAPPAARCMAPKRQVVGRAFAQLPRSCRGRRLAPPGALAARLRVPRQTSWFCRRR